MGTGGVKIFGDKKDCVDFLERLADLVSNQEWATHSTHFVKKNIA
jgi:hypothetical protein